MVTKLRERASTDPGRIPLEKMAAWNTLMMRSEFSRPPTKINWCNSENRKIGEIGEIGKMRKQEK